MIAYPRSTPAMPNQGALIIRIVGVGNAGVHLGDRLTMSGLTDVEVIVMNTDAQSLTSSISETKVALGQKVTRGLGTGGDPEVGYEAAQESLDEIRSATEGANLIFLCAGLGGGTGSGIAPVIAETAREAGATVIALVTSPFGFEGRRRHSQATEALAALGRHADAVIHFGNDQMSELSSPRAGVEETFAASDATMLSSIVSLVQILRGGNPMAVGLADLMAVLGGGSPAGLFGRGESNSENRAHEALERALKSPLLDRGRLLTDSHSLLIHIAGPANLSFSEVAAIMREIERHTDENVRQFLGVTALADPSAPLSVTLFGNYSGHEAVLPVERVERATRVAPARPSIAPPPRQAEASSEAEPLVEAESPLFAEPEPERPAVAARAPREPKAAVPKAPAVPPKVKQETLQFESVARGRFEKSEPTIVEGEDLDVPTFLRMRGRVG
ncbi:cell division protein FtsZ [soil metagenome]